MNTMTGDAVAVSDYNGQLDKLSLLAECAGHDIKNALGAAVLYLRYAKGRVENAEAAQIIDKASDVCRYTASLATQLMNITGAKEDYWDLSRVVRDMSCLFEANAHNVAFEYDLQSSGVIRGRPLDVYTIMQNLVQNASDAMPKGGRVLISTHDSLPYVVLGVADTGPGMTDLSHAFEPHYSTKGSTGLGLYSVKRAVDELGGIIRVKSAPGEGTAFEVAIPAQSPAYH